jgi:hypothetical protein
MTPELEHYLASREIFVDRLTVVETATARPLFPFIERPDVGTNFDVDRLLDEAAEACSKTPGYRHNVWCLKQLKERIQWVRSSPTERAALRRLNWFLNLFSGH